jgi:hypothetical protein
LSSRLGPRTVTIQAGDTNLVPVAPSDAAGFLGLLEDEDVSSFTPLRRGGGLPYVEQLIERYSNGWSNESSADFSIRSADDDRFLGYAGLIALDLDAQQTQLGYMVSPHARNRPSKRPGQERSPNRPLDLVAPPLRLNVSFGSLFAPQIDALNPQAALRFYARMSGYSEIRASGSAMLCQEAGDQQAVDQVGFPALLTGLTPSSRLQARVATTSATTDRHAISSSPGSVGNTSG